MLKKQANKQTSAETCVDSTKRKPRVLGEWNNGSSFFLRGQNCKIVQSMEWFESLGYGI